MSGDEKDRLPEVMVFAKPQRKDVRWAFISIREMRMPWRQMRSRNYAASVEGLGRDLLFVAITYDKDNKNKPHYCKVQKAF